MNASQTSMLASLCAGLLTLASAVAGPPLICVAFECEGPSLPMGANDLQTKKGYNVASLDEDVVAFLDGASSVIERMETIRRAALYVNREKKAADAVFAALTWRALDAEAAGDERAYADALFDAGYFAATVRNLRVKFEGDPGAAHGLAGYAWIARAVEITDDPAMHFGAALAAHPAMRHGRRDLFERHIAIAASKADAVLMRNVSAHLDHFDESLELIVQRAERRD